MITGGQKSLLARSLEDGQWVDPSYFENLDEDVLALSMVSRGARTLPEFPTDTPAEESPAQHPKDETFGHFDVVWSQRIGQARELARFLVPHGMYAVIRNIDQYVKISGFGTDFYATDAQNWGRPFRDQDEGLLLRWHLRLEHIPRYGYPVNVGGWISARNLPGWPYNKLGVWGDLRHPWGLPEKLHYGVDGGLVLRFFVEVVDATNWMW